MVNALKKFRRLVAARGLSNLIRVILCASLDACRQQRFIIEASPNWHCRYKTVWRIPTKYSATNALRRQFGVKDDFRRRAVTSIGIEERPSDVPASSTVLLASAQTLANEEIRQFLLTQASAGKLSLLYPDAIKLPQNSQISVLTGVEVDAEGQACLQNLSQQGIACVWLSATEEVALDDLPLKEACTSQAVPVANGLEIRNFSVPQNLSPPRVQTVLRRPLRILTYRWHVPHQYELFKLGAEFTLVTDLGESTCRWWDLGLRPLPANVRFARWQEIEPSEFDLAILHFDENILGASPEASIIGADWGKTFRFLLQQLTIPCIAVCHGTPTLVDTSTTASTKQAMVDFLADTTVVVNSHQAQGEWEFRSSQVIWQGFDPDEFSSRPHLGNRTPRILTLPHGSFVERPTYRGSELLEQVAIGVSAKLERLRVPEPNLLLRGNAYARAKFAHYIAALHDFDIYFNPTLHSPMPRSRGEAMLCGLATVNADSHDVDLFIRNGVNGFYAASADELTAHLGYLLKDPSNAWRIGQAGRETAIQTFHIERYLADWRQLIRGTLGNHAI